MDAAHTVYSVETRSWLKRCWRVALILLSVALMPAQGDTAEAASPGAAAANAGLDTGPGIGPDTGPGPDIRLLIDVSASMGRTDPQNVRSEAVGLLLRLLPSGARAGVWTYAKYVNMLVKYGTVDEVWRELAVIRTSKLPAVGRETRLVESVREATWDRSTDKRRERHVIVLTDGGINLDQGTEADGQATAGLLETLLPELVAANIRVHTLALSEQADQRLLKQLALVTNGHHTVLTEPEQAPRALLRILDQVQPADRLPVSPGDGFLVDAGMSELTLLRLRGQADLDLALVDPTGLRMTRTTSRNLVRWHEDAGYDLVTLENPKPGRWFFEGSPSGAGVRVLALGDLSLKVHGLPATLFPESLQSIELGLESIGQPIRDEAFVALVHVSATLEGESAPATPLLVEPLGGARFRINLLGVTDEGEYGVIVRVTGPTFQREIRAPFLVRNPVAMEVVPTTTGANVWMQLNSAEVDYRDLRVAAKVKRPPAGTTLQPVERLPAGIWKFELTADRGVMDFSFDVSGRYLDGRPFHMETDRLTLAFPLTEAQVVKLNLDGRPLAAFDLPDPAAGNPDPVTPDRATPPGAVVTAELDETDPADEMLQLPSWFAWVLGLLNLGLGGSLWILFKPPVPVVDLQAALAALRELLAPAVEPTVQQA